MSCDSLLLCFGVHLEVYEKSSEAGRVECRVPCFEMAKYLRTRSCSLQVGSNLVLITTTMGVQSTRDEE